MPDDEELSPIEVLKRHPERLEDVVRLCAAIFDRSHSAFDSRSSPLLDDPAELARVLRAHGKSIA